MIGMQQLKPIDARGHIGHFLVYVVNCTIVLCVVNVQLSNSHSERRELHDRSR
jgi:hypothetical protein